MAGTVIVPWYATGFRANDFETALNEVAAIALRYGADSYAVYRARDDRYKFQQLASFADHVDWERYWEGPEMIDFRVAPLELVPGARALRLVGPHGRRSAGHRGTPRRQRPRQRPRCPRDRGRERLRGGLSPARAGPSSTRRP